MTRHLGVSVFFSVSIVVFFAVALYPPERASVTAPKAGARPPAPAEPEPTSSQVSAPLPPTARALPVSRRTPSRPKAQRLAATTRTTRATAKPGAFIRASAGETLDDIALRVYGSTDAAGALWTANRDVLPQRDGPLDAATVLRTP